MSNIKRTCIDCKHLAIEQGEDGWYPGEHSCIHIACALQVWTLDAEDTRERFIECFRTAATCDKFETEEQA